MPANMMEVTDINQTWPKIAHHPCQQPLAAIVRLARLSSGRLQRGLLIGTIRFKLEPASSASLKWH